MKSFFGYYTARSGKAPVEATVLIFDKRLSIGYRSEEQAPLTESWHVHELQSQFVVSMHSTVIRNSRTGGELIIEGNEADLYMRALEDERKKPWHRRGSGREWIRNSLLLVAILGALFLIYLMIVPWLSSKLANRVSIQTERQLGDAVYSGMNLAGQEDTAASYVINEFWSALEVPTPYSIRISVINSATVNAFALPGGRIVIYSGLLSELGNYQQLAALLSHEFTHVHNKHATKSIFRKLGSKIFIGLLFGRFGTVSNVMIDYADDLKFLTYARGLEKEADLHGLQIITARQIDPAGFSQLFGILEKTAGGSQLPEILASHPDLSRRISYVQAASRSAVVSDQPQLKRIFDKLK